MTTKSKRSSEKPWPQFRSAYLSSEKCTLLDPGRAEVMFNMLPLLPDILKKERGAFIKAVHDASIGNPKALEALLAALRSFGELSAADVKQLKSLWASAALQARIPNAMAQLRRTCEREPFMPRSMVEALFDDASFDFVAYLAWHNSAG